MIISSRVSRRRRLSEKLIRAIAPADLDGIGELTETTSLIRSGLIDSQGLLNMALFVEREIGHPVDLTTIDLVSEWDTIADVIRFIEARR
jgi:acyl carrier protein